MLIAIGKTPERRKTLLFLKKKKQKDFYLLAAARWVFNLNRGTGAGTKVFLFFFSKKNCFLNRPAAAAA